MNVNKKIERITPNTLICGIDVGKTKCCARFCDFRGIEIYHKVWFDRTENLDVIGCHITAAMYKENKTDVIISFEPTGHYWLNIDKYFKDCGQETVLMPTYTVKQSKEQYDQNPAKSDPKDALLIARLTSEGKYVKPIERDEIYQDLYSGYRIYDYIQKEINRVKNKIHVWNDKYFPELEHVYKIHSLSIKPIYENQLLPSEINNMELDKFMDLMTKDYHFSKKKNIIKLKELCTKSNAINIDNFTKYEIKSLYNNYQELVKELEKVKNRLIELASQIDYVEKLVEISGISYISVVGIIAETGDLRNYEHPKQILKMSGLSLKESSSGQKKGKKHISKRGRAKLRRNLKQTGISLIKNNSFFLQLHTYYTTQRENKLSKLCSVNAIIRKFTYIMLSIAKTCESFNIEKAKRESCIFN